MANNDDAKPFYLTRIQAAWLAELSLDRFNITVRPLIADKDTRKRGKVLLFDGRAVSRAIREYNASLQRDPLMEGDANSPSLEKYRAARAELARLDVRDRQKQLVPIAQARTSLRRFIAALKSLLPVKLAKFGNDAEQIADEAIDEAGQYLNKSMPADER